MGKSQAPAGTTWSNVPGYQRSIKLGLFVLVNAAATRNHSVKYRVRLSRFSSVITYADKII
jgi:hypothetical protein